MKKFAVLSMGSEGWHPLDYFDKSQYDRSASTLDCIDKYLEILHEYNIKTTFFVVEELVEELTPVLQKIKKKGHELGIHSHHHIRLLLLSINEFRQDNQKAIAQLKPIIGEEPFGYRAPCFSLDQDRLNILSELGFSYDTSKIDFSNHPLYGKLDLTGFNKVQPWIYRKDNFVEFEVSTTRVFGKQMPISGGGYLRIFPWFLMRNLLKGYLKIISLYFLYIHSFELSKVKDIPLPDNTPTLAKYRFSTGIHTVEDKIRKTIEILLNKGFEIITFSELKKELLDS